MAIWLTVSITVLDTSMANVALPTIAAQLNASPAVSVWIVNAYQFTITVLLLPLAALGDRIGYRRVYLTGVAIFMLGSLGCALSNSFGTLVAARMVQGVGAAAIFALNAAMTRVTYPSTMLGRGIGYNAIVISLSASIGPTLAALILSVASWPWLFAINLPIGLAALAVGSRVLPRTSGHGRQLDYIAALLSVFALGLLVLGTETVARAGVSHGLPLVIAGLVAGVMLVYWERGRAAPLLPLDLLRIPVFSLSIATSVVSFAGQMLAFVTLPFLLQTVLGRSVVETGLLMTPWPLAVAFAAPIAGILADRVPAGLLGGIGLCIFASGLLALSMMGPDPDGAAVAWRMALCGLGFGIFQTPNNRTIVGSAPRERSGAAGGMLGMARLVGQTAGALTVASAFHALGLGSSPMLLRAAAAAALIAAALSLLRLRSTLQRQGG